MGIIDVHGHYGRWPFPIAAADADGLLRLMDRHGIERVVLSSAEAIVYDMASGNARMAKAIASRDRLFGWVVVNPHFLQASRRELERYLVSDNFVGAKIHPAYCGTSIGDPKMGALLDAIAEHRARVEIHTYSAAAAREALEHARRQPHMPIIMAHAGATEHEGAARCAAEVDNLFLEFCCSHALRGRVRSAIQIAGGERVVFGSDLDLLSPAFTLGMFHDAGLSDDEARAAFRGNAERIFGWGA
jgi:predicted TIM-barrel fold metal-dependent hydrolase